MHKLNPDLATFYDTQHGNGRAYFYNLSDNINMLYGYQSLFVRSLLWAEVQPTLNLSAETM